MNPTTDFTTPQQIADALDAAPDNDGRPSRWVADPFPGGWVCGVPDDRYVGAICGMPIESEPCRDHTQRCDHSGPYTVETDDDGWPVLVHACGHREGYTTWWGGGAAAAEFTAAHVLA